jgi:hypothetical protein
MLRPHLPGKNLLQIPQSAVYFHPHADLYKNTTLQPHISPLMGKQNWYAEAATAAQKTDLDLIGWTVFLHNSYQAQKHPECAEVTCTGDISTHHLCPANTAVRSYACALARDLAQNYGIAALECESLSFGGFGHTHYHVKYGVNLGSGGRFLLSLCFCKACHKIGQDANLDTGALCQALHNKIRTAFETGAPVQESPEELAASIPDLYAYLICREQIATSLFTQVQEAAAIPVSFIYMGSPSITGVNRNQISTLADYVEILSYTADPDRTRQTIADCMADLSSPEQLMVGLQAYPPASPTVDALIANLEAAIGMGIQKFSFYNYGIMPLSNLGWVKQALECRVT